MMDEKLRTYLGRQIPLGELVVGENTPYTHMACGGIMEPIGVAMIYSRYFAKFRCVKCGKQQIAGDDTMDYPGRPISEKEKRLGWKNCG